MSQGIINKSTLDLISETSDVKLKDFRMPAAIPCTESGIGALAGFTRTSIIGALNELKTDVNSLISYSVTIKNTNSAGVQGYILDPATTDMETVSLNAILKDPAASISAFKVSFAFGLRTTNTLSTATATPKVIVNGNTHLGAKVMRGSITRANYYQTFNINLADAVNGTLSISLACSSMGIHNFEVWLDHVYFTLKHF